MDRTNAKLVHPNGLNFSRSWCLFVIAQKLPEQYGEKIKGLANSHLANALLNVIREIIQENTG